MFLFYYLLTLFFFQNTIYINNIFNITNIFFIIKICYIFVIYFNFCYCNIYRYNKIMFNFFSKLNINKKTIYLKKIFDFFKIKNNIKINIFLFVIKIIKLKF